MPLFLQRQERLTLLDLVSAPGTVWRRIACQRKKNGGREKGKGKDADKEMRTYCEEGMERKGETEEDKMIQGIIVHF